MLTIEKLVPISPVIPVLTVTDYARCRELAEALVGGGLKVLEVTLRTPDCFAAIREMSSVPGAIVGAGTVLNERMLDAALEAGAQFIVSPGLSTTVSRATSDRGIAYLPGIATATEVMQGLDLGLTHFKFFPAMAMGGADTLKTLTGPFPAARFCPTGGLTHATAAAFLAIGAVPCVGGSWMVPGGLPDPEAIASAAMLATDAGR